MISIQLSFNRQTLDLDGRPLEAHRLFVVVETVSDNRAGSTSAVVRHLLPRVRDIEYQ